MIQILTKTFLAYSPESRRYLKADEPLLTLLPNQNNTTVFNLLRVKQNEK